MARLPSPPNASRDTHWRVGKEQAAGRRARNKVGQKQAVGRGAREAWQKKTQIQDELKMYSKEGQRALRTRISSSITAGLAPLPSIRIQNALARAEAQTVEAPAACIPRTMNDAWASEYPSAVRHAIGLYGEDGRRPPIMYQISAESDGLIESYSTADQDPKRGDINFLPSDGSPLLPSPFLRHFFVDPPPLGLVLILRCWASLCNATRWQWAELHLLMHAGKHDCFFGTAMLATVAPIISNHPISVSLIVGFFGGPASILEWIWALRTLVHLTTPILRVSPRSEAGWPTSLLFGHVGLLVKINSLKHTDKELWEELQSGTIAALEKHNSEYSGNADPESTGVPDEEELAVDCEISSNAVKRAAARSGT
ncbi:hypothetical protein B0H14DRAFT_2619121 [Mycena olivaceomarginata]|nr:hypothetical protein B0H14DRAFT_2619121 [Mycena olivaceomarginata]